MAVFSRFDTIEGYTIQNLIKSNLYTETYRIEDVDSKPYFLKVFLLKQMPAKLMNGETGIVREIEYSSQINHRNIVNHIAHGQFEREDGSYQYYITNYFNGQVLADKLATKGALDESTALAIFKGILNGLNYLHTHSVALCHNDIDTSNTLLSDTTGEAIIIDLGHLAPRSYGLVNFDTSDLNPLFHANETRANIFDEQGDLFSACVILYVMLTGELPWKVDIPTDGSYKERFAILAQHRKTHNLDLSSLHVSEKTKYILQNGLELKSNDRIANVQTILDLLNSSDASIPIQNSSAKADDGKTMSSRCGHDDPNPVDFEIKRGGGNGFQDIAGMQALKDYLYRQVIFVIKDRSLAEEYRLTPPNGMLLYGPPGCGKTYFAEKFAEETQFNFILIKASDLGSSYIHGSQEKIKKLFQIAEQNKPIVLCFDEFDALVPDRSVHNIHQSQAGEVNEFLSQMNNCAQRGIFIVATSNRPDKIDPAVLRTGRIDKNVYVPLPDLDARKEMFSLYLKKRPIADAIDIDKLAKDTEGYIASDIAFIVNDAAMMAAFSRELITQDLLEVSLQNIKPSLRKETLESYNQIQDRMEDTNRSNNIRVIVNGL